MNDTTMDLRISSQYLWHSSWHRLHGIVFVLSSFCLPAHTITPPPPRGTLFTTLTSANSLPTWSVIVTAVGRTAKISKTTFEAAYGSEISIQFSGNSSGGHSCSQHANCTLPQFETSVALCCDNCTF